MTSRLRTPRLLLHATVFSVFVSTALAQQKPLSIPPPPAQRVTIGTPLQLQLTVDGGTPPYTWRLPKLQLPRGLALDKAMGLISGSPEVAGDFKVPVTVTDSGSPPQEAQVELLITVVNLLEVKWKLLPQIRGDAIAGTVGVTNRTGRTLNLTVIVLAVNQFNKAFALGYQHFDIRGNSESPTIPFSSSLPFGSYVIHVDAVAEDLVRKNIYRSRLQTPEPLVLQQP